MLHADLELGRRYLALNPPPGDVLVCAITGSHIYGFPSPDSDLDMKGIHIAPLQTVLGLSQDLRAHDRLEVFDGVECDLTTNEVAESLRLLVAGNGNMLERILSPLQLVTSPDLEELQDLARACIGSHFSRHYMGFYGGRRRELAQRPSVKSLLYAFRVALTGIHLLRTGLLEPNVAVLAEEYGITEVPDLIAMKRAGAEHGGIEAAFLSTFDTHLDSLEAQLHHALEHCQLPAAAPNADSINHWLVQRRLRAA